MSEKPGLVIDGKPVELDLSYFYFIFPETEELSPNEKNFILKCDQLQIQPLQYVNDKGMHISAYPLEKMGSIEESGKQKILTFKDGYTHVVNEFTLICLFHASKNIDYLDCEKLHLNLLQRVENFLFDIGGHRYVFYDCEIAKVISNPKYTDWVTGAEKPIEFNSFEFNKCKIGQVDHSNSSDINKAIFLYGNTEIVLFQYKDNSDHARYLTGKDICIDYLKCQKGVLTLENSILHLIEAQAPDDVEVNFSDCKIVYKKSVFKNENIGYDRCLNTYDVLKQIPSLISEKTAIHRYELYFKSRDLWQKKFLYGFNGGYYEWKIPLTAVIATFLLGALFLEAGEYLQGSDSGFLYMLNPKLLVEKVLLKDVRLLQWEIIDFCKIGISVLAVVFYYSLFSFLTAMRRMFGFPKN